MVSSQNIKFRRESGFSNVARLFRLKGKRILVNSIKYFKRNLRNIKLLMMSKFNKLHFFKIIDSRQGMNHQWIILSNHSILIITIITNLSTLYPSSKMILPNLVALIMNKYKLNTMLNIIKIWNSKIFILSIKVLTKNPRKISKYISISSKNVNFQLIIKSISKYFVILKDKKKNQRNIWIRPIVSFKQSENWRSISSFGC